MLSAIMAESNSGNGCPRCAELEARVATLEAPVASLQVALAKAQKHSGNSSKPPSSDIVKPRRKTGKKGRRTKPKIGGQPGHDRAGRFDLCLRLAFFCRSVWALFHPTF